MQLNNKLLQLIGLRFADSDYNIDFDDYLTCIVRLENMFSRLKTSVDGRCVIVSEPDGFSLHQEFLRLWTNTRGGV